MTAARRYRLDGSTMRFGTTVIGGSPLTLLRLTTAGADVVDDIAAGRPVESSPLIDRLVDTGIAHPIPEMSGPFTPADVTIVVPTLGEPDYVPHGALVVDDGSEPPVAHAQIRLEVNRGPAAARNAGLDRVETPLVAFVDSDVDVGDGVAWLQPLLAHFTDPRVAAVAPRIAACVGTDPIDVYEHDHSPLDMGPEPARVRAGTRVPYVPAAALLCRADALRDGDGFDTSLRFGEDVDLVWRLVDDGWRVRYEPTAVVHHRSRADWGAWAKQRIDYGSSAGPLSRRHPGKLAPLRMSGWSIGAWLLVALGRPLAGLAVGIGSAVALVPKLSDIPPRESFRLAAMGNVRAGSMLAHTVRRTWWPILAIAAIRSRTARRVLAASALAVGDHRELVDDVAYSIGVWRGMWTERTFGPIVPTITSWPGRSARRSPLGKGYGRRP